MDITNTITINDWLPSLHLVMRTYLQGLLKKYLLEIKGEEEIKIKKEGIKEVMKLLRNHTQFQYKGIVDIIGIDKGRKLEIIYIIQSYRKNRRLKVRVELNEGEGIKTITEEYKGGDWLEREVYDMLGIEIIGHKDLRRILTDYGSEGHPLRKRYPLSGYMELKYDEKKKGIVHNRINER